MNRGVQNDRIEKQPLVSVVNFVVLNPRDKTIKITPLHEIMDEDHYCKQFKVHKGPLNGQEIEEVKEMVQTKVNNVANFVGTGSDVDEEENQRRLWLLMQVLINKAPNMRERMVEILLELVSDNNPASENSNKVIPLVSTNR
eukprot:UN14362